eukprot:NODE_2565_length_2189_cov_3.302134.p6 GENE.NODE_2565_length_2189_cov_3.302134~~NODE_2565_length_2189_cov_3.302134.p6  ORF type:complete len:98 (+),score=16.47 NODE_2565_length_2189_cov_3.302134:320-613(+)
MACASVRVAKEFTDQSIGNLAWAMSGLRYCDVPVFDAISSSCVRAGIHFDVPDITNLAWSCSQLCYGDEHVLVCQLPRGPRESVVSTPLDIANPLWS